MLKIFCRVASVCHVILGIIFNYGIIHFIIVAVMGEKLCQKIKKLCYNKVYQCSIYPAFFQGGGWRKAFASPPLGSGLPPLLEILFYMSSGKK